MAGSLLQEGIRGAAGALGIFLRRPEAMDYFVFTRGGFWRSFAALAVVLPFSTIWSLTQPGDPGGVAAHPLVTAALSIISDIIVWAVAPVCIYLGTRVTGTAAHWRDLVIVVNWGAIVMTAMGAAAAPIWLLLSRSAVQSSSVGGVMLLLAIAYFALVLVFYLRLAKAALRTTMLRAFVTLMIASIPGGILSFALFRLATLL